MKFYICNSFTTQHFAGNPAGVVFDDARSLSDCQMQKIANQLNLVETTFVLPPSSDEFACDMRYFTPLKELPITGHPTLAAWWVMIDQNRIRQGGGAHKIKTIGGVIDIEDQDGNIFLSQAKPDFRMIDQKGEKEILAVFSLKRTDLLDLPVIGVDTGLGHLIFGVKNLEILWNMSFDIDALQKLCEHYNLREAQIFTREVKDQGNDIHTRNFCPRPGLEDPACGNGNAALGGYFLEYVNGNGDDIRLSAEQGHIIKKPSLVKILASKNDNGDYNIKIGGRAVITAEGNFFI